MNTKICRWMLAPAALLVSALGACNSSARFTNAELAAREDELALAGERAPMSAPSHSSKWAGVLPTDSVNESPLAMAEYNTDLDRNDAAFGVVHGPPGEPMAFYASAEPPSMYLQYQFTLPQTANSVTVFRRSSDPVFTRPWRGYYRVP
ncbi:MAG: hypothetical protein JNM86_06450 [Phycisphaerae bacterium]|nr:hypothetical protein [Phycisphaerae bacterium]